MDPYIKSYRYKELKDIQKNIDTLFTDRITNILNISEKLSDMGYIVSFNIDGPMTILASLIDPMNLFKAFKKECEELRKSIDYISSLIMEFGRYIIKTGVKIISYSDSSGSIDLIGPKLFKEFCLEPNLSIIKSLELEVSDKKSIIHICGKSTYSLYASDKIDIIPYKTEEPTYKEALIKTIEQGKFKIVGNSCLGRINLKPFNSEIFEIKFNEIK